MVGTFQSCMCFTCVGLVFIGTSFLDKPDVAFGYREFPPAEAAEEKHYLRFLVVQESIDPCAAGCFFNHLECYKLK